MKPHVYPNAKHLLRLDKQNTVLGKTNSIYFSSGQNFGFLLADLLKSQKTPL